MVIKYTCISMVFLGFALAACAKTEISNSDLIATNSQAIFSDRKSVSNNHDIDGDGKTDLVELVKFSKVVNGIPSTIKLITPWPLTDEINQKSHDLKKGSHNNLLVTLGNSHQFLIHDMNAVSLLDTEAAQDLSLISKVELPELDLPEVNAKAKGDLIVIPTEAGIDTYLYWNGLTFIAYEPLELP